MSEHQPVGGKLLTPVFMLFAVLAMVAAVILVQRFAFGLGAVTNLNDGYPWGIWVVIDVVIGTAFGCGGYAVALAVYIMNRGEYHPLVRPALLAGLFGYTLGGMAVLFDLGQPWNAYNLLMPGQAQVNSVMFEVALCVMAYIVVLWLEFSPAFMEKFGWKDARKKLDRFLFVLIALGVLLPTMHQSSLGTMVTIMGYQLSPLWNTPLLPALFLISALGMGYAIVVFEAVLAAEGFKRPHETHILGRLSGIMWVGLLAFLALRFVDLIGRGALGGAFAGDLKGSMFLLETLLFILPAVILARKSYRTNKQALFVSATSLLVAGSLYRLNAYLIGYDPAGGGWSYFPSVSELMVTIGVFSLEIVLYLIFVKRLPVLSRAGHA